MAKALAIGQNGTPDLRGRFFVGQDNTSSDYSLVGNKGGFNTVKLTVDQMPSHTHNDNGHRHSTDLSTNEFGAHYHEFSNWNYHTPGAPEVHTEATLYYSKYAF